MKDRIVALTSQRGLLMHVRASHIRSVLASEYKGVNVTVKPNYAVIIDGINGNVEVDQTSYDAAFTAMLALVAEGE